MLIYCFGVFFFWLFLSSILRFNVAFESSLQIITGVCRCNFWNQRFIFVNVAGPDVNITPTSEICISYGQKGNEVSIITPSPPLLPYHSHAHHLLNIMIHIWVECMHMKVYVKNICSLFAFYLHPSPSLSPSPPLPPPIFSPSLFSVQELLFLYGFALEGNTSNTLMVRGGGGWLKSKDWGSEYLPGKHKGKYGSIELWKNFGILVQFGKFRKHASGNNGTIRYYVSFFVDIVSSIERWDVLECVDPRFYSFQINFSQQKLIADPLSDPKTVFLQAQVRNNRRECVYVWFSGN